jgi:hypothetical protein
MDSSTETIEPIKLQWIKGDKIGNVETVKGSDSEWTLFESGARISSSLINEFMIPIGSNDPVLDFDSAISTVETSPRKREQQILPKLPVERSPVRMLFDKQKNADEVTLSLSLNITVPKKEIFNIISVSFEEEEVIKELRSFIEDQIKEDLVKESIKNSIHSLIEERYM